MSKLGALHVTKITGAKHTGTVIFLHGSGGTGETIKEWVQLLVKKPFEFPHVKVLYPTAPLQPYTPAGGNMSNVWFNRDRIDIHAPENYKSLESTKFEINRLIKNENDLGIPNNRIIIGGFSMGGSLALHCGYDREEPLAGVFTFSSFLNDKSELYKQLTENKNRNLPPLLQLHGDIDELIPFEWGVEMTSRLKEFGLSIESHKLDRLGHSLNRRGLELIREWIENKLPQN